MINLLIALFLLKIRTFNMTTLDTKIFNQAMDAPFEQLDKVVSYIDDLCTRQISQNPYPIRVLPS